MPCKLHNDEQAQELFDRAFNLCEKGHFVDSLEILEHLLKYHGNIIAEWNIKEIMGECNFNLGNYDEAERDLKSAEALIADIRGYSLHKLVIYHTIGSTYLKKNDYQRALKYFDIAESYFHLYKGRKWASSRYEFYLERGRCYYQLVEYQEAYRDFRAAYKEILKRKKYSDVSNSENHIKFELAITLIRLKSFAGARDLLQQVDPDRLDPLYKSLYCYKWFHLYVIFGDYESALREFEEVESQGMLGVERAEAYYVLGIMYFRQGLHGKARESFNKALSIKTDYKWLHEDSIAYLKDIDKAS